MTAKRHTIDTRQNSNAHRSDEKGPTSDFQYKGYNGSTKTMPRDCRAILARLARFMVYSLIFAEGRNLKCPCF